MLAEIERHPLVIVPGYRSSGPDHWQTFWENAHPDSRRTAPASFDVLDLDDWVRAVDDAITGCTSPPLIAAHSSGCLATLALAADGRAAGRVTALLLVAPPDPSAPSFPEGGQSFRGVVGHPPDVPAAVVASTNDPYAAVEYPTDLARLCGARLVVVGALGHINAESALGDWPEGQKILADLISPGVC